MTDVEDVHHTLSIKAMDIANEKSLADPRVPPQYGRLFRPLTHGRLGLTFSPAFVQQGGPLLEVLQEIGRASVHQAILENPNLIGSLIIGEARKGRDYFES